MFLYTEIKINRTSSWEFCDLLELKPLKRMNGDLKSNLARLINSDVIEGTPLELTGRDMIRLLPPEPTEITNEIDEQTLYLMQQSRKKAIELAHMLDSSDWKYIKFHNLVELERMPGEILGIKLELNVMATVDKIVSFFNDYQKLYNTDENYGIMDTKWKIGTNMSVVHQRMKYQLPGGKRDFAVGVYEYRLNEDSVAIVRHSIEPDFSDSKANKIPLLPDYIRGELESLILIQKNTDKSSLVYAVLKYDLKGEVDEEDIRDLEELRFQHFLNIKLALEKEK